MNKQDTYLLTTFRSLGEIINHKDTEIAVLNYEIEKLKEKLSSVEKHLDSYYEKKEEKV